MGFNPEYSFAMLFLSVNKDNFSPLLSFFYDMLQTVVLG